jgi:hypothetical protein
MIAMSLPSAARTATTENQDLPVAAVDTANESSAPSGEASAAQDLGQLAQHLTKGDANSAPGTGQNTAARATEAGASPHGAVAAAPVLNLPPAGQHAAAAPDQAPNDGSGSRGSQVQSGAPQQRSGRLDRTPQRQAAVRSATPVRPMAPARSMAMEEQFRVISAKLPQLLEQALHELETRSKIEFDRKWTASVTVLEQRLAEMNQRLNDGLPERPAGAAGAAASAENAERLRKENQEQRRRLGFYRAALCLLCGAFVLGAALFFSLIVPS